ncbi:MAG: D-alanyl-D-alanine carboxypeptidase family protein [Thermodesulfovibrionales bacterium]|jgi:D-alanyl-D-alanine carboxypeptidase (penicillin-binding protein 5/6)
MEKQRKERNAKCRVWGRRMCFFLVVSFLMFHYPLSASSAEEIRARAALVMEESTGRVLYGKNPNLRQPPASTTKLMTAMVILDRLDVQDVVTISERAANISPIKAHFRAGEKVTVKTLLYAALIRSANDAACALAEAGAGSDERFAELMNQKALALGMTDTRFVNPTGLPGGEQYTTVYDLAKMMRKALRYPLIREIMSTRVGNLTTENGRSFRLKNINKLLWEDDAVVGGKTGYTREAKHCFVCAGQQDNELVIVAVLGAPSREMLWRESEELLGKGFAVRNSQEEPVIYFTRSDYNTSVRKASYHTGSPEDKSVPHRKRTKKSGKGIKRKKSKARAKTFVEKTDRYQESRYQLIGDNGVNG